MSDPDLTPKQVLASQVALSQVMEITDANVMGIVHGGVVMKLVDRAAGLAAMKHIGGLAVTVAMNEMSFLARRASAARPARRTRRRYASTAWAAPEPASPPAATPAARGTACGTMEGSPTIDNRGPAHDR